MPEDERPALIEKYRKALADDGRPFFVMSAATREGTQELVKAIAEELHRRQKEAEAARAIAEEKAAQEELPHEEIDMSEKPL